MSVASVYAVFADLEEAERIGGLMVEERLAACVNILAPVRSIYRWQGEVRRAEEVAAILKTRTDRVPELLARIGKLHSYDLPCVVAWPVSDALPPLLQWIGDSVGEGQG